MYFIGIDLGTSGLRAILVDQYGSFVASSEAKYTVTNKNPGWSEQDPEDWIKACKLVFKELQTNFPNEISKLRSIGVAGHMHGRFYWINYKNQFDPAYFGMILDLT